MSASKSSTEGSSLPESEPRHPNRKGKVESSIGHTQKTPLKGQRFDSPEEAQAYLDNWEAKWADTRIHGTTKRQVAAMFAEENPHLLSLPAEPFRYYCFGQRGVHLDGHLEVEGAYYSVPPDFIAPGTRCSPRPSRAGANRTGRRPLPLRCSARC